MAPASMALVTLRGLVSGLMRNPRASEATRSRAEGFASAVERLTGDREPRNITLHIGEAGHRSLVARHLSGEESWAPPPSPDPSSED